MFCSKGLPGASKSLMIRDPNPNELALLAKRTSANVRKREQMIEQSASKPTQPNGLMDSARGSEMKA
jgi:hypothetical protein